VPLGHSLLFSSTRAKATGLRQSRSTIVQRFAGAPVRDACHPKADRFAKLFTRG
jgi:hypothetical protein